MTILPARSPHERMASRVAPHGVARTTASARAAASLFVATAIPVAAASFLDFSAPGSRTPNVTSWPRFTHARASLSPTPPPPITAMFMASLLGSRVVGSPGTDAAEALGRDAGYVPRLVANRRRRKHHLRRHVDVRQALQQIDGASLDDPRPAVHDEVLGEADGILAAAEAREDD